MNPKKIAVAGGTGTVGVHVVDVARRRGHDVIVLSRSAGVDLVNGTGIAEVLDTVDVVVDVTSTPTMSAGRSKRFFSAVTGTLLAAEAEAGVDHHLALSIVGVDSAPYAYYAGKVLQERLIENGNVPWTILRATQFHEFASQIYGRVKVGPFVVVPSMRSQPIAARDVAIRLVDLAEQPAAGRVADLGGPREEAMIDLVRAYASSIAGTAEHAGGRIIRFPIPGAYGRAMRDGSLLPGPEADHSTLTFAEWSNTTNNTGLD